MNHPVVVAHRGDPIHEVENTLPALLSAVAQGADLVETDVRLTVDGEVVLLHDATTERIWGDPRPAAAQTLAEITAHRPTVTPNPDGDADARVPSLADALLAIAPAALLIDLPDDVETACAAWRVVAEVLREQVAADGVTAPVPAPRWCGELAGLRAVRTLDPGAEIWMTWKSHGMPPQELVDELVPRSWNPEHGRVDAESVAAATELGLATTCWTVDDPQRAAELAALGAAGIISNRAAAVREHLAGAER